jgi:hypothetical protein
LDFPVILCVQEHSLSSNYAGTNQGVFALNKARGCVFILLVVAVGLAVYIKFGVPLVSRDPAMILYLIVNRIFVLNNVPYLYVPWDTTGLVNASINPCPDDFIRSRYFFSPDDGKTWQEIPSLPGEIPYSPRGPICPFIDTSSQRTVACVPHQPKICYRLSGQPQVEISRNGGQTWQTDWRIPIPIERIESTLRNARTLWNRWIAKPDRIPFDLGIIERNGKYAVMVTMGNQGVLVKGFDGKWERYGVYWSDPSYDKVSAVPLPYYATILEDLVDMLGREFGGILFATGVFFVLIGWRRKYDTGYFLLFTLLPFLLWAFGLIAAYEVALVSSIALGLVVLAGSILLAK